jgi:hypothetical protein
LGKGPASADGEINSIISSNDKGRLARFDDSRRSAFEAAGKSTDKAAVAVLEQIESGELLPVEGTFDATGVWRCRYAKLGGDPPLVVYDWFTCRISDNGAGWVLDKLGGSQRTSGRLFTDRDTRLIYLGAVHYAEEKPLAYGSHPERDQVAYVMRPSENRLRFEFPAPRFESEFDILELVR